MFRRLSVERSGNSVSPQGKARERPLREEHNCRRQERRVPRELMGDTPVKARGLKTAATSFAIGDMCGDAKYIQQAGI
jgi:hypothetical protein